MRRFATLALAALVAAPLAGVQAASPSAPGCDGRRAVLHQVGGGRATGSVPLACAVSTGYAIAESHLNVAPDGTVVVTPAVLPAGALGTGYPIPVGTAQSNASPGALTVTHDQGKTWSLISPSGTTWNPTDHGDYIDPVTGRIFFEDYGPIPTYAPFGAEQEGPAHLNVSADGGKTWKHSVLDTIQLPENPQYAAGPVPPGGDPTVGYPRVTYFCANNTIGFTSPVIAQRLCFRSLDGGETFTQRSTILRGNVPVHSECNGQPENLSAVDGHYPRPGPHGELYLLVSCGPLTFLAKSTDEALTFPALLRGETVRTIPIPAAQTPDFNTSALQVLDDGTLAVVSHESTRLMLRVSKDEGLTWSKPADVTAPGLSGAATWAISSRGADLALTYLGSRANDPAFYGYVAVVRRVRSLADGTGATVATGLVRRQPMLFGSNQLGPAVMGAGTVHGPLGVEAPFPPPFTISLFGNDFLGSAIAPDGSPWGSFTLDCGPTPQSPGCQANGGQTRGLIGHLVASAAIARPVVVPPKQGGPSLPVTGGVPLGAVGLLVVVLLAVRRRRFR